MKRSPGRMITKAISDSHGISNLSPKALSLFCMIIPHFDSYGKIKANPHLLKGLVCPLIDWLDVEEIPQMLEEISTHTNVKFWTTEGIGYLQALNWEEHQKLEKNKRGTDHFPNYPNLDSNQNDDYSATSRRLLAHEDKEEVEVELENEVKKKGEAEVEVEPAPVSLEDRRRLLEIQAEEIKAQY